MSKAPKMRNWKDVERTIGQIGEKDREIGKLIADFETRVEKLKATLVAPADALKNEKVALERAVEDFVLEHKDDFEGSTRQFPTGEVQVAASPASVVCYEGEETTLTILKKKELDHFIRVKETVNKVAIKDAKLDERQLKAIKVRMESKDRVTIRPLEGKLSKKLPGAA